MPEPFTDRSRHVLMKAQDEAWRAGSTVIDPDHLLLALLDAPGDDPVVAAVTSQGISVKAMRQALDRPASPASCPALEALPFGERLNTALEQAFLQAVRTGYDAIRPEHLFLGLLADDGGIAVRSLAEAGGDRARLQRRVVNDLRASIGGGPVNASATDCSGHGAAERIGSPGNAPPSPSSCSLAARCSPPTASSARSDHATATGASSATGPGVTGSGVALDQAIGDEPSAGHGSARPDVLPQLARRVTGWGGTERSLSTQSMRAALLRYRIMAYVVGTLLTILCFVGLPLQFVAHNDVVVEVVGTVHGYCYLVYLAVAYDMARRVRWRIGRLIPVVLGGLVPGLAFFMERRITPQVQADIDLAEGH